MSLFTQSPLFVLESALENLFEGNATVDQILRITELQYNRVLGWLESFESMEEEAQAIPEIHQLSIVGNSVMLESLQALYDAVSQDCEESVEEAFELLAEGHEVVEKSLYLCEVAEREGDEAVVESLEFQFA